MFVPKLLLAAVAWLVVTTAHAMYTKSSGVVTLTPDNFEQEVLASDAIWLVEFYAPWCGHCKNLAPDYKKLAQATSGIVKVGAIDADAHKSLGSRYGVTGFPTLKIFGGDKQKPANYEGARTADAMAKALMQEAKTVVTQRVSGKANKSNKSDKKSRKSSGGAGVIELDQASFEADVIGGEDPWIVAFTAPWCGHCKNLKAPFKDAAATMNGKVKFGNVDATVHTQLAQQYGVQGYPTIKVFSGSGAKRSQGVPYNGGREKEDLVAHARTLAPVPKVVELVDEKAFAPCAEELCVVAFLPDLYAADAAKRKSMIDVLKKTARANRSSGLNWFWTAKGSQSALEKSFLRGSSNFPAVVAYSGLKNMIATMQTGFDEANLGKFAASVASGRARSSALDSPAKVESVAKWDGKDAVIEEYDEIDLDELFKDEL